MIVHVTIDVVHSCKISSGDPLFLSLEMIANTPLQTISHFRAKVYVRKKQLLLIFIHILIVYFIVYKLENAKQRKHGALNLTKCFVSHLDIPNHYKK